MASELNPVRVWVQEEKVFTDSRKQIWMPDRFWTGGQAGIGSAFVDGTQDPGLYSKERYGNFTYAIPGWRRRGGSRVRCVLQWRGAAPQL